MPGSRLSRNPDAGLFERSGAAVLTFDRPGYGESTPQRDRSILSVAEDVVALADEVGWGRFAVLGISGGGPHALAVAAIAPGRVTRVGVAVGMTPPRLIDREQLVAFNREGLRIAGEEGRAALEAFMAEPARQIAADPATALERSLPDAPLQDRELLQDPAVRAALAEGMHEAFKHGPYGWFDDSWLVFANDWGYDPRAISRPLHLWYGAEDKLVPVDAARAFAAELRPASFQILAETGHAGWLRMESDVLKTILAD